MRYACIPSSMRLLVQQKRHTSSSRAFEGTSAAPRMRCRAMEQRAEIGVFGGSGFYSLLERPHEEWIETPYGLPSDTVHLGEIGGRRVAFLPRHGSDHRFPPHMINYRANMYAMKSLGVKWIVGPTASGSLKPG